MHELALARSALDRVLARVRRGERVVLVELSLGELDADAAAALGDRFRELARGTAAEEALVRVGRRSARLRCGRCGLGTPLSWPVGPCPRCGGPLSATDLKGLRVERVRALAPEGPTGVGPRAHGGSSREG